jgi:hypothetical protein
MAVYAYVPDLMDRSKVVAVVPAAVVVADPGALSPATGDTVVLDLSRPAAMAAVPRLCRTGARVIGFASHIDRERIDAARTAGCDVLPRSAFFGRLSELLA